MLQPTTSTSIIHIAVADDHALIRSSISATINSYENCRVIIQADNGRDLLQKMEQAPTLPDIVILDISMPVLNGYDCLEEIKKKWPEQKVIMLSLIEEEYAILRTIASGANGYLSKGCLAEDLQNSIREVYHYGSFFSETVSDEKIKKLKVSELPKISKRELQFLELNCIEYKYSKIAATMGISVRTVESIQESLAEKLKINSRVGLALFAVRTGIAH